MHGNKVLQLFKTVAKSCVSIAAFPGPEELDMFIKTGSLHRAENDAWLHPATFSYHDTRLELLTALAALKKRLPSGFHKNIGLTVISMVCFGSLYMECCL